MVTYKKGDRVIMNFDEGDFALGTVYSHESFGSVHVIHDETEDMYDLSPIQLIRLPLTNSPALNKFLELCLTKKLPPLRNSNGP
jgi:hypothetical protein